MLDVGNPRLKHDAVIGSTRSSSWSSDQSLGFDFIPMLYALALWNNIL